MGIYRYRQENHYGQDQESILAGGAASGAGRPESLEMRVLGLLSAVARLKSEISFGLGHKEVSFQ